MSTQIMGSRRGVAKQRPFVQAVVLAMLVAPSACITAAPMASPRGSFSYDNTASAACRQNPANCAAATGKDIEFAQHVGNVASAAATLKVLFEQARGSIEKKLEECANEARAAVLIRHRDEFKAKIPDAEECRQMTQNKGRKLSWAQRLGEEMRGSW